MHPFAQHIGPVIEHLVGIGRIAPVGREEEVLTQGKEGIEGDELIEVRRGLFELYLELARPCSTNAKRINRQFAVGNRLGVLNRIGDKGVLGGCLGVHYSAPGKDKILRRDKLTIAP